ncbi:hypothetical protein F0562_033983 [Nyssa sinensis]|uniref:TCP domain-containing protein n=1 Tax=Nyssa sinensis TaxID=561372 RepID=A0A5J5AGC0_9ASTE|nr:hypothetical protein F0562_033983 [Nyssa sinensis]
MIPSSNIFNPFSYTEETLFQQYYPNDENPNSRQEEPASLFSHFPSPFLDVYDTLFVHPVPQQQLMVSGAGGLAEIETNAGASNKATGINTGMTSNTATDPTPSKVNPKKRAEGAKKPNLPRRAGKKDRHSKICTAHGLRDRRMRLSLPVARKFFGLQDLLGFDKASKTIDWLFTKSKMAIKELTRNLPQMKNSCRSGGRIASSTSQRLVASGLEENVINNEDKKGQTPLESRNKARARARERTKEKMMIRSLEKAKQLFEANPKNLENFGFSAPLEVGAEELSIRLENDSNLQAVAEIEEPNSHSLEHQLAIVDMIEKFLGTPSSSASHSTFNDHRNNIAVSDSLAEEGITTRSTNSKENKRKTLLIKHSQKSKSSEDGIGQTQTMAQLPDSKGVLKFPPIDDTRDNGLENLGLKAFG